MLSPATFIGIANATGPVGQPPPTTSPGQSSNIQPARVLTTPPATAPIAQSPTRSAPIASPNLSTTPPPRNLPRGSLLDLSV